MSFDTKTQTKADTIITVLRVTNMVWKIDQRGIIVGGRVKA